MVIFPLSFGYCSHTYRASYSWLKDLVLFWSYFNVLWLSDPVEKGGKSFISHETSLRFWNFYELTKVVFNKRTSSRPKTSADETALLLEFVIWPFKDLQNPQSSFLISFCQSVVHLQRDMFFLVFFLRPRNPYRLHWKYFRACDFFGKIFRKHFYTRPVVPILLMLVIFFRMWTPFSGEELKNHQGENFGGTPIFEHADFFF